MAAISDTVYARDRDVHLVYQVVCDGGPSGGSGQVPVTTMPVSP